MVLKVILPVLISNVVKILPPLGKNFFMEPTPTDLDMTSKNKNITSICQLEINSGKLMFIPPFMKKKGVMKANPTVLSFRLTEGYSAKKSAIANPRMKAGNIGWLLARAPKNIRTKNRKNKNFISGSITLSPYLLKNQRIILGTNKIINIEPKINRNV